MNLSAPPGPTSSFRTPAVQALLRTAPWLAAVLFLFSLLCAFVYSRCISRPIVRLSRIAEQMEKLDFGWECGEARRDEIGAPGRSLDRMARRLSETLGELTSANEALQGEMERERQRTAFFSAVSLAPGITVTGDAALLKKAVGNLLSNASLHSPEGARIRVWCGSLGEAPAFSVENTGAHIREEALAHLFEAFYREESSRSRSMGGSGLGLYLAQIIFKRHGARCMIENTDDRVKATVLFKCQPPV